MLIKLSRLDSREDSRMNEKLVGRRLHKKAGCGRSTLSYDLGKSNTALPAHSELVRLPPTNFDMV